MVTQIERMAKIETKIEVIDKKQDGYDTKIDAHVLQQREDFQLVFSKLDDLKKGFANKWVEKFIVGILITVVGGVSIVAIIALVKYFITG